MIGSAFRRLSGPGIGAVLYRGALILLIIQVAGTGIGFAVQVFLARLLGPESYGHYAYVVNGLAILLLTSQLGIPMATLRFVSAYTAEENWPRLRGFLSTAAQTVGVGSVATAGTLAILLVGFGEKLAPELAGAMWVVLVALPGAALLPSWSQALRGFKAVAQSQLPQSVVQPIALGLAAFALFAVLGDSFDARWAAAAHVLAVTLAAGVAGSLLWFRLPREVRSARSEVRFAEWRRVTLPLMLMNGLQIGRARVGVLLMGFFADASEVGFYSATTRIASLTVFGLVAVGSWAGPLISELHVSGQHEKLQRLAILAARATTAFVFPIALLLLFFGDQVLGLFGPEFVVARTALLVLMAGQVVNAATGPVGYLLVMTGHQAAAARVETITTLLGMGLALWLIPRYGMLGAAVATAVGDASRNLVMVPVAYRKLRIRSTIL